MAHFNVRAFEIPHAHLHRFAVGAKLRPVIVTRAGRVTPLICAVLTLSTLALFTTAASVHVKRTRVSSRRQPAEVVECRPEAVRDASCVGTPQPVGQQSARPSYPAVAQLTERGCNAGEGGCVQLSGMVGGRRGCGAPTCAYLGTPHRRPKPECNRTAAPASLRTCDAEHRHSKRYHARTQPHLRRLSTRLVSNAPVNKTDASAGKVSTALHRVLILVRKTAAYAVGTLS